MVIFNFICNYLDFFKFFCNLVLVCLIVWRCVHYLDEDASFLWQNIRHNSKYFLNETPLVTSISGFIMGRYIDASLSTTITPIQIQTQFKASNDSTQSQTILDTFEYKDQHKIGMVQGSFGSYSDSGYYLKNSDDWSSVGKYFYIKIFQLILCFQ